MLSNTRYDKIKLMHKLSCLIWFIERHGIQDAEAANDQETLQAMRELKQDLQGHLEKIDKLCCCKSEGEGCPSCE